MKGNVLFIRTWTIIISVRRHTLAFFIQVQNKLTRIHRYALLWASIFGETIWYSVVYRTLSEVVKVVDIVYKNKERNWLISHSNFPFVVTRCWDQQHCDEKCQGAVLMKYKLEKPDCTDSWICILVKQQNTAQQLMIMRKNFMTWELSILCCRDCQVKLHSKVVLK